MSLKRDLELLYEIGCLRFLQRTWKQFLNPNYASLAEHTLRVTWLALLLAKYEKLNNHEKILKMALVHDLPESRAGDVHYVSRLYTQRQELEALRDISKQTIVEDELIELWKEYEERKSDEAKIVKDADVLDIDLELQEQAAKGDRSKIVWRKQRSVLYTRLYFPSSKRLWKAIKASNPHDWHVRSKNRLTAGDWKQKP